jgi:hypothetical protein
MQVLDVPGDEAVEGVFRFVGGEEDALFEAMAGDLWPSP